MLNMTFSGQIMYRQRVTIEDFRIFSLLQVELNKTLNVIVGENNSRKTALVDAIRYTLSSRSGEWLRILESDFRRGTTKFSIQLRFADLSPQQAAAFLEHLIPSLTDFDSWDSQNATNLNRLRKREVCDGFGDFFAIGF